MGDFAGGQKATCLWTTKSTWTLRDFFYFYFCWLQSKQTMTITIEKFITSNNGDANNKPKQQLTDDRQPWKQLIALRHCEALVLCQSAVDCWRTQMFGRTGWSQAMLAVRDCSSAAAHLLRQPICATATACIGLFNNKLLSPATALVLWPCEAISLYQSIIACCEGSFFRSSSSVAPTHPCHCCCMHWPIQQQTTFPSSSFGTLALWGNKSVLEHHCLLWGIILPEQLICCTNPSMPLPLHALAYSTTNYFPQQQLWHFGLVRL